MEVANVFASVGARFDDSGFDRFDRRLRSTRQTAERGVTADLDAKVNTRGFSKFDSEVKGAERSSGRLKGSFAMLGPAAAAGGVAAAAGLGLIGKAAVTSASDVNESLSKNRVLFGDYAKDIEAFAKTSASSYGISRKAALEYTGTFGNLLRSTGLGRKEAAGMSEQMVKLAADMASFNNASPEETLDAIRSGLVGETEPLKRFGVNLNETTLKAEAMRQGIADGKAPLDAQAKALAASALITKQTAAAHGDFARTSGGLANQQRILTARISDVGASLGAKLLPVALKVVSGVNSLVGAFTEGGKSGGKFGRVIRDVGEFVRDAGRWIGRTFDGIRDAFSGGNKDATKLGSNARSVFGLITKAGRDLWSSLKRAFDGIGDDLAIIGRALLKFYSAASSVFLPIARRVIPAMTQAFSGVAEVVRGVIRVVAGLLSGDFRKAWDGIKGIVSGAIKAALGVVKASTAPFRTAIAGIGSAIGAGFSAAFGKVKSTAVGFINGIIDVINVLPGVSLGKVGGGGSSSSGSSGGGGDSDNDGEGGRASSASASTSSRASLPGLTIKTRGVGAYFAGGVVDAPIAIVGEEAPEHPEVIIPSNPAYRRRAIDLWATAGRMIGVPGFFAGGLIGKVGGAAKAVVGGATKLLELGPIAGAKKLIGALPGNPFSGPMAGMGDYAIDKARDYIVDKAKSVLDFATGLGGGGGGVANGNPIVAKVARMFGLSIGSGYRTPAHNAAVNGVPNSLHTHGTPANPGARDLNGPVPNLYRALAWVRANLKLREALVHDVGSGLHLHLGFFKKGGVRKKVKRTSGFGGNYEQTNRGIVRSRNRVETGLRPYETQIQRMERDYSQTDRAFSLTEEEFVTENEDGSTTVNTAAVEQRAGELGTLIKKREAIKAKIEEYRRAVKAAIQTYTAMIARLRSMLAAAKGKARQKDRGRYREMIDGYISRRGELRGVFTDLGDDVTDSNIDLRELGNELGTVNSTKATPATVDPTSDTGAEDSGALDRANSRAGILAGELAAAKSNLTAFGSGEFAFGAGGSALGRALMMADPTYLGAGGPAGAVGGGAGVAGGGGPVTVNVEVRSFVPPSGAEAVRLGGVVAGALDANGYRQTPTTRVG